MMTPLALRDRADKNRQFEIRLRDERRDQFEQNAATRLR